MKLEVKAEKLIAQAETSPQAEADRLYKQGVTQADRSDNTAALLSLETALALYQQLNDRTGNYESLRWSQGIEWVWQRVWVAQKTR